MYKDNLLWQLRPSLSDGHFRAVIHIGSYICLNWRKRFVQITKYSNGGCICPNYQMCLFPITKCSYLSKRPNVFVQMYKIVCPNSIMYLSMNASIEPVNKLWTLRERGMKWRRKCAHLSKNIKLWSPQNNWILSRRKKIIATKLNSFEKCHVSLNSIKKYHASQTNWIPPHVHCVEFVWSSIENRKSC